MKKKNIAFLSFLALVLIGAFITTFNYPPRARFFPLLVIVLCFGFVLLQFLREIKTTEESKETDTDKGRRGGKFVVMALWLVGFAFAIWLLGFVIALPLFMFLYIKTYEKGWFWSITLALLMFVIVYYGFGVLLECPLYEGFVFLR